MAIVEVKVPQLSESVAEATLLQWKKKPGEAVAIDEILIEIETDKVVLEVPAPAAGVLAEIVKADGATVRRRTGDRADRHRGHGEGRCGAAAAAPAAAAPLRRPAPAAAAAQPPRGGSKGDVAMPAAAKLMADNKLAAGSVAGTGKDGRVTKGDVLGALAAPPKPAPHAGAAADATAAAPRPRRCPPCRPRLQPEPGRAPRAARADVAPARAHRRAPGAVAVHQRHPDDLQRGQHGAGDGDAQEVPGAGSRRSTASSSAS